MHQHSRPPPPRPPELVNDDQLLTQTRLEKTRRGFIVIIVCKEGFYADSRRFT